MAEAATSAPALLIGGPTASGKSGLALSLAREHEGVVINADSMQVYRDLAIMTARPDAEEMEEAPHRLFGFLDAAQPCSVAFWLDAARRAAQEAVAAGHVPILVGGTGLYLAAFVEGISPMPDVPPQARQEIACRMAERGSAALHQELAALDPETAARLPPGDRQRIVRALEVVIATGTPLSAWQKLPREGGWNGPVLQINVDPDRQDLRSACDSRFDAMMACGALEEIAALAARGLDPDLPAMRALGVPPLIEHLAGRMALEEAVERAKAGTRQYAKRQATWFRNQSRQALRIEGFGHGPAAESALEAAAGFLLTACGPRA